MMKTQIKWARWLAPALFVLVLVLYSPVRHHDFINYDDPDYVTDNTYVQKGFTWKGLRWAFGELHGEHTYWHPVTWLSHMLDCQLFGLNAGWHHLMNVLLHGFNGVLVFLLLRRMTGETWPSWFVAALFAVHPLQVDTVAWVSERKNVLSTMFWMLTLLAYTAYVRKGSTLHAPRSKQSSDKPRPMFRASSGWYALALVLFVLGLMTKPILVTLPCVMLLLDYWPLKRFDHSAHRIRSSLPRLLLEKAPFFLVAVIVGLITVRAHAALDALQTSLPLLPRIENAVVSYGRYLLKAIWPSHLAVYYPHPGDWPVGLVATSAAVLLVITGFAAWKVRTAPFLAVGWLWFLASLMPTIGIIPAGSQAMADRFAYVPLIGVFILACWGATRVARVWGKPQSAAAAGTMALLAGVICTSLQLEHWKNSRTLFEHTLEVTRDNVTGHFNLGNALIDHGETEAGMAHLREALRLNSNFATLHAKYAHALATQGHVDEAVPHYRQALRLKPNFAGAMNNLAWILATHPEPQVRNGDEAVRLALRACEITGRKKAVYIGTLAAAFAEVGQYNEAVRTGEEAAALATAEGQHQLADLNKKLVTKYRARQAHRS